MVRVTRKTVNIPDHRIEWLAPGVVWSMDDTQCLGTKIEQIQDLASIYKFPALISASMTADKIAEHLEKLFSKYGPPLFLKRDNAGNLNHECINKVLEDYWVIPFNSPIHYPPYNGGIEKSQGELKAKANQLSTQRVSEHLIQATLHDLNHMPRRTLSGQNSCEVFYRDRRTIRYNRKQRKEVFDWVRQKALTLLDQEVCPTKHQRHAAWRTAVKLWLENNGCIRIVKVQKVSPNFFELLSHN